MDGPRRSGLAGLLEAHSRMTALALGVVSVAVMVVAAEVVCALLLEPAKPGTITRAAGLYEPDEVLGYRLASDRLVDAVRTEPGKAPVELVYTLDSHHRRHTPVSHPEQRTRFVAFLGGSFTFGEGIDDRETLPYFVGELAPDCMPYNYGISGQGPQHMLLLLREGTLQEEIPQKTGIAVYTFIEGHVHRAIGAMPQFNRWVSTFPYFYLRNGELVHGGTFETGRPWTSLLYHALYKSYTLRYLRVFLPRKFTAGHYDVTAAIINESARLFKEQFPGSRFCVLVYYCTDRIADEVTKRLDSSITVLNCTSMLYQLRTKLPDMVLSDYHPTGKSNKRVAERLAEELGLCQAPGATGNGLADAHGTRPSATGGTPTQGHGVSVALPAIE